MVHSHTEISSFLPEARMDCMCVVMAQDFALRTHLRIERQEILDVT